MHILWREDHSSSHMLCYCDALARLRFEIFRVSFQHRRGLRGLAWGDHVLRWVDSNHGTEAGDKRVHRAPTVSPILFNVSYFFKIDISKNK